MSTETEPENGKFYKFKYRWPIVIKALWEKYPNRILNIVKFNNTIDIKIVNDNILHVKKLMFTKYNFFWIYSIENQVYDFSKEILSVKTHVIKKSSFVMMKMKGIEEITYRKLESGETLYSKFIKTKTNLNTILDLISNNYKNGIKIVEDKCEELKQSHFKKI